MIVKASSVEMQVQEHLLRFAGGLVLCAVIAFGRAKWIKFQQYLDTNAMKRMQKDNS
jgi:hypothetical protein